MITRTRNRHKCIAKGSRYESAKFYMEESFDAYEYFGAHLEDGGVVFRTYAPNAWGINVMGAFNGWKEEPLQQLHQSGVWVGFSRTAKPGNDAQL